MTHFKKIAEAGPNNVRQVKPRLLNSFRAINFRNELITKLLLNLTGIQNVLFMVNDDKNGKKFWS